MQLPPATEIKHKLDGRKIEYGCKACSLEPPDTAVLFYVVPDGWHHDEPNIDLPAGSLTLAYYWRDRPYNVYHWLRPNGETIGCYFNISTDTSIHEWGVEWFDLEVDYWVPTDGSPAFLDEDALPPDLDMDILNRIDAAKRELVYTGVSMATGIQERSQEWLRRYGLASR